MSGADYPADYGAVPMGGHCGILATAIFAGRTFQQAWDALHLEIPFAWKRSGRWKGKTNHGQRMAVLERWNVPHRVTPHVSKGSLAFLPEGLGYLPRCSVATFAARHAKPGVTYMLRVSGHVVTLRDGIVIDQSAAAPAACHRAARSLITVSIERL